MRDGLQGSYLENLDCLGKVLLVKLGRGGGGLSDLRIADGLMTLVDEVNLERASLLAREVLGLEEGHRVHTFQVLRLNVQIFLMFSYHGQTLELIFHVLHKESSSLSGTMSILTGRFSFERGNLFINCVAITK